MCPATAIAFQNAVQHSITFVIGLEQSSAGAIPKNDTGCTVAVVYNTAHFVAAYYYHFFEPATFNIHCTRGKCIYKSGTSCAHIKSPGIFCSYLIADNIGGGREQHVRGYSGNNQTINLFWANSPFSANFFHHRDPKDCR